MENKVTVELRNLTTGYVARSSRVLIEKNVNAALHEGEFCCLLGPNGAGKSTLLRTLSGFMPPLSGMVMLFDRPLGAYSDQELSRKISVVLSDRPSVTSMTVEQLVALGRSPYTGFWGRLTDRDHKVVEHSMELAAVDSFRHRLVDTLSDGERQRVMIAKALAQETPVIFLDEPTAFLDFPSKAEMMRILRHLAHKEGKTVMLSTHDINMALDLADSLWLVDKRIGMETGTTAELAESGALARYFAAPGISFDKAAMQFTLKK